MSQHKNEFSILSMNIESLNAKFDDLILYLENFKNNGIQFSAICLQETWFSHSTPLNMFKIPGYNLISQSRTTSIRGGLAIYLHATFQYKSLQIPGNNELWEKQFIEITCLKNDKKIVLGNIYRLPRNLNENVNAFIEEFSTVLSHLQGYKSELVIAGDFNIDLIKYKEKAAFSDFLEMIFSQCVYPTITYPTRITSHSATLIDNFLCRFSTTFSHINTGILVHRISDHQPYFITLNNIKQNINNRPNIIQFRKYSEEAIRRFNNDLTNAFQNNILDESPDADPNLNYETFHDILIKARDTNFPSIITKFNKHKHKKTPWITNGLLRSIKYRDQLHRKLKNTTLANVFSH